MSLNGLEVAEVNEAYQSALNEGGGWSVFAVEQDEDPARS